MDKELLISISNEEISNVPIQDDSENNKGSTSVSNEDKSDDEEEIMLVDENSEDIENLTSVCDKGDSWNGRLVIVSNEDDSEERECVPHKISSRGEEYLTFVSNEDISDDTKGWTSVTKENAFEDKDDFSTVPNENASKNERLSTADSNEENSGVKECKTAVSVSSGDS